MAYQGIYRDILMYRNFPEGLLTGSGSRMDALRTLASPPLKNRFKGEMTSLRGLAATAGPVDSPGDFTA